MKSELLRAGFFLLLAVLLFMLPGGFSDAVRLKVYGLFADAGRAVSTIEEKNIVYDSSVPPAQRVVELINEISGKDAEISSLKRELRNLIEFRNIFPLTRITAARVIGYRPGSSAPEVCLSAGSAMGVKKGDTLVQGGTFAGKVFLVEDSASMAMLVDNPGCVVAGRLVKSGEICTVRGEGYNRAKAVFYVSQTSSAPGDMIVTSELLGKTPPGLVVATLDDYPRRGAEPGTMEAPVRIQARLWALEDVILVGVQDALPDKNKNAAGAGVSGAAGVNGAAGTGGLSGADKASSR